MGFGSLLGSLAGKIGSKIIPIPGVDGEKLGGFLGGLTGFKRGGRVRKTGAKVRKVKKSKPRRKSK